jgi:hypothetical protein
MHRLNTRDAPIADPYSGIPRLTKLAYLAHNVGMSTDLTGPSHCGWPTQSGAADVA